MKDAIRVKIQCHLGTEYQHGLVYYGNRSPYIESSSYVSDETMQWISDVFANRNTDRAWLRESGVPL